MAILCFVLVEVAVPNVMSRITCLVGLQIHTY